MTGRAAGAGPTDEDLARFARTLGAMPAHPTWLDRLLRALLRCGCRLAGWTIDLHGIERLPSHGGRAGAGVVVVVAPHRAWVEPFLLVAAWPARGARPVWLADGGTVTRSWWRRRLLPHLGVIPVERRIRGPGTYVALARMALATDRALVIFPEVGPPSAPTRVRRLSAGFAYIALGAGAAVVPVVVGGTHRIVRGSPFSLDVLAPFEAGPAIEPFTVSGRERARRLRDEVEAAMGAVLPARTAEADHAAPARERWRWLGSLFD